MDTQELSKRYMQEYESIVKQFEERRISDMVSELNESISRSDMDKTGELYNKVLDWNGKVEQLEGARLVLDSQFHYLRLPSAAAFGVVFDGEEKVWRFNTVKS